MLFDSHDKEIGRATGLFVRSRIPFSENHFYPLTGLGRVQKHGPDEAGGSDHDRDPLHTQAGIELLGHRLAIQDDDKAPT